MIILAALAGAVIGMGAGLLMIGVACHRLHNQLFKAHLDHIKSLDPGPRRGHEIQRFHENPALELCHHGMALEPIGWLTFFAGIVLLVLIWP